MTSKTKTNIALLTISTASIIILVFLPPEILGQWQNALIGQPCNVYDDVFNPDLTCDNSIGLLCQERNQRQGQDQGRPSPSPAYRCDCYGDFVYDRVSEQCRRRLGNTCQPIRNLTQYNLQPWNLKCEQNAECVSTISGSASTRNSGSCQCRSGFARNPLGANCLQVRSRRGWFNH